MEVEGLERQVQVRFRTELKEELRVVNTPFSVPANLTRYGLSEVINALLGTENPIPFDFLLDGELIRISLEKLMISKHLSAESILNIEYIPAVVPPSPKHSHLHDDWVSAVDGSQDRLIFTGSYDACARVWNEEGVCVGLLKGHKGPVTSLSVVSSSDGKVVLATASKDRTLRLWQIAAPIKGALAPKTIKSRECCVGHLSSVQSVSASPSGNQICSGSWDSSIKLWNVSKESEDHDGAADGVGAESKIHAEEALQGHTQCVSGVEWVDPDYLFSVSWDHSLRSWSVETKANTGTLTCSKALHCLSVGGDGSAMVATGGADHVLRIWDPRMPGTVTSVLQLSSHKAWITACKWHRKSTHHLISGSHDGTVKLWDIRAKVPLHTVEVHKEKVLCADWWKDDCIVSGGSDSQLQIMHELKISR